MNDLIQRLRGIRRFGPDDFEMLREVADTLEVANARIADFERILDGVTQDMIDGGWTARGISAYAKKLETRIAALEQELRNIANADKGEWDDPTQFEAWAKSRARWTLEKTK